MFLGNGSPESRQIRNQLPTVQDAAQYQASAFRMPQEKGLVDLTGYIPARVGFRMALKNPISKPFVERNIPDPKWWKNTRDYKNDAFNSTMVAGSGLSAADEWLDIYQRGKENRYAK